MLFRKPLHELFQKKINCENVTTLTRTLFSKKSKKVTKEYIDTEKAHAAHIYEPLPVVIDRGEGCNVWDVEGKMYLDFLAGYATLNTGHCHPKIVNKMKEQASKLHHTCRAFYNSVLPSFSECVTGMFNYEKVIPMNTGVEGGETAIKIARRWGYLRKKIPENEAIVIMAENNFWGRTMSAISSSTNPIMYQHFGPFMPGFAIIPFNNIKALEEALCNPNVCAFMVEPIQGEGGVNVPCDTYLSAVRKLCSEKNVLWIADEVQTGLGRTGYLLACDHECVRPDLLIIGKGLAGGIVPMSAVLGNGETMHLMTPGTHGSTFGGNPLACSLAMTTLEVIKEEKLIENAKNMGQKFRCELQCRLPKDIVPIVRGRGLLNAIQINPAYGNALNICMQLKDKGLLTKNMDSCTIRFTPPLTIDECQLREAIQIISDVIHSLKPVC
ncbi:ornithine aminotransferase precursor isoform X1 [Rhodnius prolixus]